MAVDLRKAVAASNKATGVFQKTIEKLAFVNKGINETIGELNSEIINIEEEIKLKRQEVTDLISLRQENEETIKKVEGIIG